MYRGVNNKVDLQVRTSDQKKKNIGTVTLVFNLLGSETEELILKKDCVVRDATQGMVSVNILEHELDDIEPGNYKYSIVSETRTNIQDGTYKVTSRSPLFIDSQYGTISTLEILGDLYGEPIASKEIKEFGQSSFTNESKFFTSSIIDAEQKLQTPQSQHTFQFIFTNYSGSITIQGSQSNSSDPETWSDLLTFNVDEESSMYRNIEGKFNWFRIRHIPDDSARIATFVIAQTILSAYHVSIRETGLGYEVGDIITVLGSRLGGETTANDLLITVQSVDNDGRITGITWAGNSYPGVRTFVLSGSLPNVGTIDKILYR
jgi:hypothetical protein